MMIARATNIFLLLATILLTGCDSESLESAKEKANKTAQEIAQKSKEIGNDLMVKGRDLSEWSVDKVGDYSKELLEKHGDDINAAGAVINDLLNAIAKDPDIKLEPAERVARMIVLMIPLVGPTKRYADARKLYDSAEDDGDELKMQKARRECIVAMAEAGLDIGTLGLISTNVDLAAKGTDKVLAILKLARNLDKLTGADLKTFDDFVNVLLQDSTIRGGIDMALSADFSKLVRPISKSQPQQSNS